MQRKLFASLLACGLACAAQVAKADTTVTVDPGGSWIGFMNVFERPVNGGGYVFGSSWAPADLTATFSGSVLTLGPNSVNDPSSFWYLPAGGPGSVGNKTMDANMYIESDDGSLSGTNVTFTGTVLSNTFNPLWTTVAFIKDFAPDFSSSTSTTIALTPGTFNITLATNATAGRHIQYGFETIGPDIWITDAATAGNAQVTAAPEPTSLALVGLTVVGLGTRARRRA